MTVRVCGSVKIDDFVLDVDMAVDNEIIGLSGANGIGKTTLLRLLSGLERLHTGSLEIDGIVVDDSASIFVSADERSVGMMFQYSTLLRFLTVAENVAFALRSVGMSRRGTLAAARAKLDEFGIAHLADLRPEQLSGGQTQRVEIARAIIRNPALVLLDEPFSMLDQSARIATIATLRDLLRKMHGSKFVVTHNRDDIARLCDREIVLN